MAKLQLDEGITSQQKPFLGPYTIANNLADRQKEQLQQQGKESARIAESLLKAKGVTLPTTPTRPAPVAQTQEEKALVKAAEEAIAARTAPKPVETQIERPLVRAEETPKPTSALSEVTKAIRSDDDTNLGLMPYAGSSDQPARNLNLRGAKAQDEADFREPGPAETVQYRNRKVIDEPSAMVASETIPARPQPQGARVEPGPIEKVSTVSKKKGVPWYQLLAEILESGGRGYLGDTSPTAQQRRVASEREEVASEQARADKIAELEAQRVEADLAYQRQIDAQREEWERQRQLAQEERQMSSQEWRERLLAESQQKKELTELENRAAMERLKAQEAAETARRREAAKEAAAAKPAVTPGSIYGL